MKSLKYTSFLSVTIATLRATGKRRAATASASARVRTITGLAIALTISTGASAQVVRDSVAGTLVTWEMVRVPGGTVTLDGKSVEVAPFFIGRTEVSWDLYDVYMLRLDQKGSHPNADAVARPSLPYAVPDYEWGHTGYAAISIAYGAANRFAEWLSAKTGHKYRLMTEAEWLHAARLAIGNEPLDRARIDALAWHRDNADRKTHPIGSKQPDALGLHDFFGNAAEWVITDGRKQVTRGGSFRDAPQTIGLNARAEKQDFWTERDPQLPSSIWWLSDGPFVGFRLVREP